MPYVKEKHLDMMARIHREDNAKTSSIGVVPAVKDPARKENCRADLHKFLVTYFPNSIGLTPLSADHARVIERLQLAILGWGRVCNAIYRGAAKSTISERAALWAVLYGYRRFVVLFGADSVASAENLHSIKGELYDNDLLYEDFPEVCHAVRALDDKPQRARSQHHKGVLTGIEWTAERVKMPSVADNLAGGAVIATRGITAGFRGLKAKLKDGTVLRPDFVILDDPQTDACASSPTQVRKVLATLRKGIAKIGGHRRGLAMVMNATVIEENDAVDQVLNDPSWQAERIPLVKAWPAAHETLWLGRYAELRRSYDRDDPEGQQRAHRAATAFYAGNRADMDAGGVVSWESCYKADEGELSALQHAYNALIDDGPEAFASEYQQQPLPRQELDPDAVTPDEVSRKLNGLPRGRAPLWASRVTAFIDVQETLLFYAVCGWSDEFSGAVLAYGTYPDQGRAYFTLRDAKKRLAQATGVDGVEAQVHRGLTTLGESLLGASWEREDGAAVKVERLLVDAGHMDATIKNWVRSQGRGDVILPSFGRYYGARKAPIGEWVKKEGERVGQDWILRKASGPHLGKTLIFDSNRWKTFLAARLRVAYPGAGSLTLYGKDPAQHRMLADHLTSEKVTQVSADGRTVGEWELLPSRDNHWLDCVVGCAVAASTLGVSLADSRPAPKKERGPRMTLEQMKAKAKAGRK